MGVLNFTFCGGGIDLIKDKAPINFFLPHPHFSRCDRVGTGNSIFKMPKFRTMHVNMPQLFTVLKGEMSFVGRRPALFNQYDLMELRTQRWQGLFLIWNRRSTQIDADGITPLLHCGGFSHWSNLPRLWRMKLPPDEDDIVILT